jgi:phage shock protein PspC (stress-responsive transcriptional regulator)/FtsH-binding integral membrane protein
VIRRSTTDRVAAGVCGGLGQYFRVDPVLFRVLFAVSAFFGGAGIVAYLLAWAVIPDTTTADAPLDRFVRELRKRHIPFWLVAGIVILIGWAVLFSWWAPAPFFPLVIAVIVLVVALSRRKTTAGTVAAAGPVNAGFPTEPGSPLEATFPIQGLPDQPTGWVPETQAWISESRVRSRLRRHRAAPIRWITLGVLAATLAVLVVCDVVSGIVIPAYLWTAGGIILAGLVTGLVMRRTPWSISLLLIPTVVGLVAFAGSRASLHDGTGQKFWTPGSTAQLDSSYRLAFGQGVLNLSDIKLNSDKQVSITLGAGQVRILVPKGLHVRVHARVHLGTVRLDGSDDFLPGNSKSSGVNLDLVVPSSTQLGPVLNIDVHLTDGEVSVENV